MPSKGQYAVGLAIALVLLGALIFAIGSGMKADEAASDCVSGTGIVIERVASLSPAEMNETEAFAELGPVEQRVFLEAYTKSSGDIRNGDTYQNLPPEWSESDFRYIEYRDTYWRVFGFHSDCGPEIGSLVINVGVGGLLLGSLILIIVRLWERRDTPQ